METREEMKYRGKVYPVYPTKPLRVAATRLGESSLFHVVIGELHTMDGRFLTTSCGRVMRIPVRYASLPEGMGEKEFYDQLEKYPTLFEICEACGSKDDFLAALIDESEYRKRRDVELKIGTDARIADEGWDKLGFVIEGWIKFDAMCCDEEMTCKVGDQEVTVPVNDVARMILEKEG